MEDRALASETRNNSRMIPHDVLLEILSRVPGRSLIRFSRVCKLWNSLFHDPYFANLQLNHASKNPSYFLGYSSVILTDQVAFYSFKLEAGKMVLGDKFIVPVKSQSLYRFSNACNGLIAIYGWHTAYVANPFTREWAALPKPTAHRLERGRYLRPPGPFVGLGFSRATGKYKLVRIFYRDATCWACEVLTLGTDRSWRSLGDVPYPLTQFEAAHANGRLYWTINDLEYAGPERILSFDICREKFMTVQLPQCRPVPNGTCRHFCTSVLEGSMCLVDWRVCFDSEKLEDDGKHSYAPVMHIYMLKSQEEEESIWTESQCVTLGRVRIRWIHGKPDLPYISMVPIDFQNGKVFLYRKYHNWRLHDLHSGTWWKIKLPRLQELGGILNRSKPFSCAESIVPISGMEYRRPKKVGRCQLSRPE